MMAPVQNLVPTQQLLRLLSSAALLLAGLVSSASAAGPTVQDSMAQRTLACTACHGKEGRATSDGYYPRIAGKPAGYLYHQLLNFRDGRRHYGLMTQMVDLLSDDYLREIAEHYASIELPYPPPQPAAAPPAVLQRGQQLVQQGDTQRQLPGCGARMRRTAWRRSPTGCATKTWWPWLAGWLRRRRRCRPNLLQPCPR